MAPKIEHTPRQLEPSVTGGSSTINIETLPWATEAKCLHAEPDTFFPEKGGSTREAKQICNGIGVIAAKNGLPIIMGGCPVRDECLEFALANDERFGIWGGMSERERRRLKRLAS